MRDPAETVVRMVQVVLLLLIVGVVRWHFVVWLSFKSDIPPG